MTEVRDPGAAPLAITGSSGGARWEVHLDRSILLPGRLVSGRITIQAEREIDARGLVVALIAEEHWRHTETRHGPNNTTTTEVVTSTEELLREPVLVHGALHLGAGETWTGTFEQPVPAMGPATLEAEDAGLEWTFEAKLDVPGGLDSSVDRAIVVAQPTALLRAGAVHVGEFALYESVDIAGDGVTASIKLEPMPLACGEPFSGRIELSFADATKLQEIRGELRVDVEATVSSGESEEITAWSGVLTPAGTYQGSVGIDVSGTLDPRPLPTIELPHGRAQATFRVILAKAWTVDAHLVRDVALATTTEL
jgi:arrestin (S-antigen)-like protein